MITLNRKLFLVQSARFLSNLQIQKNGSEKIQAKNELNWNDALPYEKIPGPTRFSMLKYFLPGYKYSKLLKNRFYKSFRSEFGVIYKIPGIFGKADKIVTHDPESFEKVLRTEGSCPSRPFHDTFVYYRKIVNPKAYMNYGGLISEQGEKWAKFRNIVNPVLMQPRTVQTYIPRMNNVADEFIEKIRCIRDPISNEVPGTFEEIISYWVLESISVVAFDTHLGLLRDENIKQDAKELIKELDKFWKLTPELDLKPSLWKIVGTPKYYELMKTFDILTKIIQKYINESMERYQCIDKLDSRKEHDKSVLERLSKYDKEVAVVMAIDLFVAGVDTTLTAFTGILLALAKSPEKQVKLREEMRKILPSKHSPLTIENMSNLSYLRACIKEGLRLYPVVQIVLRKTGQDIVLNNYQVPKNTAVTMMISKIHSNIHFFERSNEFIPERWLRERNTSNDEHLVPKKPKNPFTFIPFGFGPRYCIGKRIAQMELEVILAKIIRNFNVEFDYSTKDVFKLNLIFVPCKELKFKFTEIEDSKISN